MAGAEYLDISVAFGAGTPPWPGDTPFSCGWAWAMQAGASVNVSKWELSPHLGTHADAPLHVSAEGVGADRLPLGPFLGEALVVDLRPVAAVAVTLEALRTAGWRPGTRRLLLRTDATVATGTFPESWPALLPEAAAALAADGLQLLGVDAPSVDPRESKTLAVHHALFGGGAFVLENLDLRQVSAGAYRLVAPPLKVWAADAAPVRAVLRRG